MRQIKFRVWYKEEKTMVEASMAGNGNFMVGNPWKFGDESGGTVLIRNLELYEIIQFTGLLDKNGKEIYEGDILKEPRAVSPEMSGEWTPLKDDIFEVKDLLSFFMRLGEDYDHIVEEEKKDFLKGKFFEVIGNIYENGELLK